MFRCAYHAVAALALFAGAANASVLVSGNNGGSLAAEAEFSVSGSNLVIRLSNSSTFDTLVPADVLTAVFWDISGAPVALTRTSVVLGGTSSAVGSGGTDPGNAVGGEWAYKNNGATFPGGRAYGVSSSGLGDFGPGDRFPGNNLEGPTNPDGMQYGLLSVGDNIATMNGGMAGNTFIKHEVVITMGGLPANFDLGRIGNVWFQYGTDYSEGGFVPTPAGVAAFGVAGMFATRRRRK